MKIGAFTTPNEKGQIVIPKEIRDALGIDTSVTLNIMQAGKGIYIYPVEEFITKADGESSYVHLLEKTKGSWGDLNKEDIIRTEKTQLELEASKKRKKVW
jgi:AbrB family looped-hinge helix DNA binding protein